MPDFSRRDLFVTTALAATAITFITLATRLHNASLARANALGLAEPDMTVTTLADATSLTDTTLLGD